MLKIFFVERDVEQRAQGNIYVELLFICALFVRYWCVIVAISVRYQCDIGVVFIYFMRLLEVHVSLYVKKIKYINLSLEFKYFFSYC